MYLSCTTVKAFPAEGGAAWCDQVTQGRCDELRSSSVVRVFVEHCVTLDVTRGNESYGDRDAVYSQGPVSWRQTTVK